jgi:superfamily I DNA and RNA helicase
MKVDEQIEWGNRLHVFSSWGSFSQPESGMYSYICHKYGLPFKSYNENKNFDELCEEAIESLNEKEIVDPCFDYIFIDESQDFGEKFFELCGKICKVTVYIAGDIFQNIFDANINMEVEPTYLLNKCYRTDPKTLMFAHAVGMGLYEEHPINWLEDTEWGFCGYTYERKPLEFRLSRSPLRRFEDLNATNTIRLLACANDNCCEKVLSCINTIKSENKSVQAEDIAIIILAKYRTLCSIADNIEFELYNQYKWESSKGYETKEKKPDKVYISNINNIKGLEFPFIICVVPGIVSDNIKYRNSIYMALTRSFLTSYFIVGSGNEEFINIYQKAIIDITQHGAMLLKEPSEEEKQRMASKIQITLETQKRSLSEILDELFTLEYPKLSKESRELVNDTLTKISKHWTEKQICKKAQAFIEEVLEGE